VNIDDAFRLQKVLDQITDHLPKCPKCQGTGFEVTHKKRALAGGTLLYTVEHPCPDCKDHPGKASIQRCLAIAGGVINDVDEHGTGTWQSVREYLLTGELRPW
jgi:DnaJ-class molecular chaperone